MMRPTPVRSRVRWSGAAADERSFELMGMTISPRMTGADSDGRCVVMELGVAPGAGPPLHVCHREDKSIHVLEGRFEVEVGGEQRALSVGEGVLVPRGVPHAFRNSGGRAGRVLVVLAPAGHDTFLREFAQLSADDVEGAAELCARYGVELLAEE